MSDVVEGAQTPKPATLIFGTFDVRNYGDLLFPVIADWRLGGSGGTLRPVSPTGTNVRWADTLPPVAFDRLLSKATSPGGLLIGGGNIVHAARTRLADYREGDLPTTAYPSLWLGAALLAAIHDAPIAWNAPGVVTTLDLPARTMRHVLDAADYVSVRDQASAELLGGHGVVVVPDTAMDISRLWSREALAVQWSALLARKGWPPDTRCLFVHVKQRSAPNLEGLAARLDELAAETGLVLLLGALGPCHGDDLIARRLGLMLRRPHICLHDPLGLREMAAGIAWSEAYLGNSLHGFITASAYRTPATLVTVGLHKFAGFAEQIGQAAALTTDWEVAASRVRSRPAGLGETAVSAVHQRLDAHWAAIDTALASAKTKRSQRVALLRHHLKSASKTGGASWLVRPWLTAGLST